VSSGLPGPKGFLFFFCARKCHESSSWNGSLKVYPSADGLFLFSFWAPSPLFPLEGRFALNPSEEIVENFF